MAFIIIYFHFWGIYVEDAHPGAFVLRLVWLCLGGLTIIYLAFHGQVWVVRANRDVVMRGVQGLMDKLNLEYTLEGDRFDLPDIGFWIEVNSFVRSDLIGIRTPWRRVPIWTKAIHEEVLNLFVGRPSERSHPSLIIVGSVLLVFGFVIGVAYALN